MIKTPKKKSKEVLEFATIAKEAAAMMRLLQTYRSPAGKGPDQHFALHHSQFSSNPYNFFVINNWVVNAPENEVCVVVNPKIIEKDSSTRKRVREGCMSFPFRNGILVNRYDKIKVTFQVPSEDGKKLLDKEEEMTGIMAQIFQHEVQHAHGHHIYLGTKSH